MSSKNHDYKYFYTYIKREKNNNKNFPSFIAVTIVYYCVYQFRYKEQVNTFRNKNVKNLILQNIY